MSLRGICVADDTAISIARLPCATYTPISAQRGNAGFLTNFNPPIPPSPSTNPLTWSTQTPPRDLFSSCCGSNFLSFPRKRESSFVGWVSTHAVPRTAGILPAFLYPCHPERSRGNGHPEHRRRIYLTKRRKATPLKTPHPHQPNISPLIR